MAKKGGVDLTKAQKEEIRRLTQLANRRIKAAFKAYEKEGMRVAPKDVTGNIQIREQWHTMEYALSRSTKFQTQKEYREHLKYLKSFEHQRVGIKEYTQVQRSKTVDAIFTSLGEVPDSIQEKISKFSAPKLSQFWERYSKNAAKLGTRYSSDKAMETTLTDFFPEDMKALTEG